MRSFLHALGLTLAWAPAAMATPSSTMWTPMTLDIQPRGILHIGMDDYFTVGRKAEDGAGAFATDAGLTLGVLPGSKFQMEIGVDYFGATDNPWFFNLKGGAPEGSLFKNAPALEAGVFNVGTEKGVTDQDIFYGVVGKTLLPVARISAGPYSGNGAVLKDAQGEKENTGFMVGADRGFFPRKDAAGQEFNAVVLAADYASGNNALGAGAIGVYYYFHPNVSLLTGPVWFNEEAINGKWKWSIQLDVNHPRLFGK